MEEERDMVTFSDDEGNEFEMEVIEYFDYEGQEYAVLLDPETEGDEDEAAEVYIMKVVVDGDMEEFLPADEELMPKLTEIVEQMFEEWDDECECDCDCEEHHCDCGCDHQHE